MPTKPTKIIAEAGVNHNGDLVLAKELIDCAVQAKADIVKFQTFNANDLATSNAPKAAYQKLTTDSNESQLRMLKKLQLSIEAHYELKAYADNKNIEFLSTAFDLSSINFLKSLNLKRMKIPSGELTNYPYLVTIAKTNLPLLISSGMASLEEIKDALKVINQFSRSPNITILHCTTSYPAPFADVNLSALKTLNDVFNLPIGYSDHTNGIEIAIAAVSLGAKVIEKHFTLDRNLPGPDHKASLQPEELQLMVESIRNVDSAIGDGIKVPRNSEIDNIKIARKSLVAAVAIKKGEIFSEINLTTKRPATGLSPMLWPKIIGTQATRDYVVDENIEL